MARLRVLITSFTMASRTCGVLYVRGLALRLLRIGHLPLVYSPNLGPVADELRRATIPVIDDLSTLAAPPDVVHGNHTLETIVALLQFPEVPAVFVCHGWSSWATAAPRLDRVLRYVAVDDTCRDQLHCIDGIPADIKKRAKLLVLNYPNSPTGAVATPDFYRRVIDFAHKHQVVVVQDAAHILLSYQGEPYSFLQVDGAKEVGVEVHSMSKGFNMIGWRLGFVCGHPKIVQAYADVKDNSDSGQFMAIQHAAAQALRTPAIPVAVRAKYKRRLEKLVAALQQVGFRCSMPGGTYFLYAAAPQAAGGRAFASAEEASQYLIHEQSISCVPWDDAGAYLRFSVTYTARDEAEEDALMAETVTRLKGMNLKF